MAGLFEKLQTLSLIQSLSMQPLIQIAQNEPLILSNYIFQEQLKSIFNLRNLQAQLQDTVSIRQEGFFYRMFQNNIQSELSKNQLFNIGQSGIVASHSIITKSEQKPQDNFNIGALKTQKDTFQHSYNPQITLECQIKNIVEFFISKFGLASQIEIEKERQKYENDTTLSQIFDSLTLKYSSLTKTKEEMIKYIFRKALKSMKDKLKAGSKKNDKEVSKVFCQKYFLRIKDQEHIKDLANEEEFLDLLMPFKKTSKNKTMNSNFLSRIFASENFCADYQIYLSEFENEADYDNDLKIQRFVSFIMNCIKSNKISHILNYKRVPWLKIWVLNARTIGYQLINEKSILKVPKIPKLESKLVSSNIQTPDSECKTETISTSESVSNCKLKVSQMRDQKIIVKQRSFPFVQVHNFKLF